MTVPVQTPEIAHTGNGVTTSFAFDFKVLAAGDLVVRVDGALGVLNVDYTVSGVGVEAGGDVVFTLPPASLAAVTIQRVISLGRATDYQYSGDFQSPTVNLDFDRLWMAAQEGYRVGLRAIRLPIGDLASTELPSAAARALKGLAFDVSGNIIAAPASDATSLAALLASSATATTGAGALGYDATRSYAAGTAGFAIKAIGGGIVTQLADATNAANGAGMSGYGAGLSYSAGTVGAAIKASALVLTNMADQTDAAKGAALIGWKLNATGSVGRTLAGLLAERVSVKDFGAVGNNSANDTAAIQAAIDHCVATGKELFFPAGTYRYTALTVAGKLTMRGCGWEDTILRRTVTTGTGIAVDTPLAFRCSGFTFDSTGTVTAGATISLHSSAPSTANQHTHITDCTFTSQFDCITTDAAYLWKIQNCTFNLYAQRAIHVQNSYNGDAGDSMVGPGNVFHGAHTVNSIAINQISSGGLRVLGNKVVEGGYGYLMILAHTIQTGALIITGNSFENLRVGGIQMNRIAGGSADMHFTGVSITGNEFLGTATGIPINLNDTDASWLQGVSITGNQIDILHAGTPAYAILVNGAAGFNITGNTIIGNTGGTGGIGIGANATAGVVGSNQITGITAGIVNSSTSTSVVKRVLHGSTSGITCSTAIGSVFKGTGSISFPANMFGSVPRVFCTVNNAGSNGIGANAVTITTSGATIEAIAATTGAGVQVSWTAQADY